MFTVSKWDRVAVPVILLLLLVFCSSQVHAGKTVDVVKEIHKNLYVADKKMADDYEEAAKSLDVARRLIGELEAADPSNPNLSIFQKKMERLTTLLRRWSRVSAREAEKEGRIVVLAD